jgi:ribosomal protein S18 acetylase RimI-like enzyme
MTPEPRIRRELRPGDLDALVAHHRRVYGREHGVDADFAEHVAASVARVADRSFPTSREAICLVELDGEHAGSIALTDEGNHEAALRWVLLDVKLRGHGLGRRLVAEMLEKARAAGYARVWLATFSELEAAAHLYRSHGFKLVSEDTRPRWGRDAITYQRYELELDQNDTSEEEPHRDHRLSHLAERQ